MRILDIIDTEDRIVVLRESIILYHTQSRTHVTTGDALLSIFDKEMNLISNTVVPKKFVIPASVGMSSSLHARNGKLLMISGTSSGGNRESLFAQIDLATGKVNVLEHLQKEKIRSRYPCEPRATVWFNNHFAVSYMDPDIKFGRIYRLQTNLQLYKIN